MSSPQLQENRLPECPLCVLSPAAKASWPEQLKPPSRLGSPQRRLEDGWSSCCVGPEKLKEREASKKGGRGI